MAQMSKETMVQMSCRQSFFSDRLRDGAWYQVRASVSDRFRCCSRGKEARCGCGGCVAVETDIGADDGDGGDVVSKKERLTRKRSSTEKKTKTIVCGSQTFNNSQFLGAAEEHGLEAVDVVVVGGGGRHGAATRDFRGARGGRCAVGHRRHAQVIEEDLGGCGVVVVVVAVHLAKLRLECLVVVCADATCVRACRVRF